MKPAQTTAVLKTTMKTELNLQDADGFTNSSWTRTRA